MEVPRSQEPKPKNYQCHILTVFFIIGIIVPLIAIFVGIQYSKDSCQDSDRSDFHLNSWLLTSGLELLIFVFLFFTFSCGDAFSEEWDTYESSMRCRTIVIALFGIIHFINIVVGAIIIFRNNPDCLEEMIGIAAVMILTLNMILAIFNCICVSSGILILLGVINIPHN